MVHQHEKTEHGRAFAVGVILNASLVIGEAIIGSLIGSLALLADAGHNLSDVFGLLLGWGGYILAQRAPTVRRTYGLKRSSIVSALLSSMLLFIAIGSIGWEAVRRLLKAEPAPGPGVIWVATLAALINAGTAFLFLRGRKSDVNIRGAFLHMVADTGVSLGVVLAGIIMQITGWNWVDPAISLCIAAVLLISTWKLSHESLDLALDAVPWGIDHEAVRKYLANLPGVTEVHDLHIWGLSTTETALTAHIVVSSVLNEDASWEW